MAKTIERNLGITPDHGKISVWLFFIMFSLLLSIAFMYFTEFFERRVIAQDKCKIFLMKYGYILMIAAIVALIGGFIAAKALGQPKSEYNFSDGYIEVNSKLMSGLICDEGEFSWTEKECEVILSVDDSCTILKIEASTVTTQKLIVVDVFIEDVLAGSFELENDRKSYEFALPEKLPGEARIRLVCSDIFIPAEEGIDDTRELGMQLYYIGVE